MYVWVMRMSVENVPSWIAVKQRVELIGDFWEDIDCNGDLITNSEIKIIEYLSWIGVFDGMWLVLI